MQNKKVLQFMKDYAEIHDIDFEIEKDDSGEWAGRYFVGSNRIVISKDYAQDPETTEESLLSTFFHECMHVKCFRMGIFPLYHSLPTSPDKFKKRLSQAIRAEMKVDLMAKEEMKNYFPDLKFETTYLGKKGQENREALMEILR
jgi:hypothetical protein